MIEYVMRITEDEGQILTIRTLRGRDFTQVERMVGEAYMDLFDAIFALVEENKKPTHEYRNL